MNADAMINQTGLAQGTRRCALQTASRSTTLGTRLQRACRAGGRLPRCNGSQGDAEHCAIRPVQHNPPFMTLKRKFSALREQRTTTQGTACVRSPSHVTANLAVGL